MRNPADLAHLFADRFVEHWDERDTVEILQETGAIPMRRGEPR